MEKLIDSLEILSDLPFVKWKKVENFDSLNTFKFPYYLKANVNSPKTEIGAVLKCNDLLDANNGLRNFRKKFSDKEIIIQENFDGIEMILGLKEDEAFGKILVVGFGGIFTEKNPDVSFRALPVLRMDIISMVKDLRSFSVFNSRGKKHNLEKFYTLIEKVAYLGEKNNIMELDLNPVIVGEFDSKIVDARLLIN
tara:strand:- start:2929 stop:3513 length:585 start_codon:yes stop_codon:yes gene_type:complete